MNGQSRHSDAFDMTLAVKLLKLLSKITLTLLKNANRCKGAMQGPEKNIREAFNIIDDSLSKFANV